MGTADDDLQPIKDAFRQRHPSPIEEVIKVDQTDEEIIADEIDEYVVTDAIRSHYTAIFDSYRETPNKPHEGIAIWVSGFFGSGKSSFAKMLGLVDREPDDRWGSRLRARFASARGDTKLAGPAQDHQREDPDARGHLRRLDRPRHPQRQPDADRDHVSALPQSLGYAKDLDLAELEIALEEQRQARSVRGRVPASSIGKDWDDREGKGRLRAQRGERACMHSSTRRPTRWRTPG